MDEISEITNRYTTITITKETRDLLTELCKKNESYEALILKMRDAYLSLLNRTEELK